MTIKRLTSTAAVLPAVAIARAGAPRRRLIILASVLLVLLASALLAVTTLSPPAARAAQGTSRPLTGTGTGTTTVNLVTGAATVDSTGHLSHLGAVTGYFNVMFAPSVSGFTYTGTGTYVAANGDKLFVTLTGSGTVTGTTGKSTDTDTITGGTGRFAGASGTYEETISSVVVSVTGTNQTSRFTAAGEGQIRY